MSLFETERLVVRDLVLDDAPFILELLNDPDWIRYIGDRGVRTLDDARRYLANGPIAMVSREGFGLRLVALPDGTPIGLCGLIRRPWMRDIDLGFAYMPAYRGRGYALEAAAATLRHARDVLGIRRVAALTTPDNEPSQRVLGKLGFAFERVIPFDDTPEEVRLYTLAL